MDPEIKLKKLKKLDYDELFKATEKFHLKSEESAEKVTKLFCKNKASKIKSKLIEHKKIWNLESIKLNNQKRKLQREIDTFITTSDLDFTETKSQIAEMHVDFRAAVVEPVFTLSDDIKEWINKRNFSVKVPDQESVKDVLLTTTSKLETVSRQLRSEVANLSQTLEPISSLYSGVITRENIHDKVGTGIPRDAHELRMVDYDNDPETAAEMMAELLSQFIYLDQHFQARLDALSQENNFVDEINEPPSPWTVGDAELFAYIEDYYRVHVTQDRQQMLLDIKRTVFTHHSIQQLRSMSEWSEARHVLRNKCASMAGDWRRDRTEMTLKVREVVEEHNERCLEMQRDAEKAQEQQHLCRLLWTKVNEWREMKKELQELQDEVAREKEKEEIFLAEEMMERELERRDRQKRKVHQFQQVRCHQREKEATERAQRLQELQEKLRVQAEADRARVEFREVVRREKERATEHRKMAEAEERRRADEKLIELAESVKPHVESDPERILKPTTAWLGRIIINEEETDVDSAVISEAGCVQGASLHRQGLPLHTYTDRAILADPRVRVEVALRQAGLIGSAYAGAALRGLPQAGRGPRRDCGLSAADFLRHEDPPTF